MTLKDFLWESSDKDKEPKTGAPAHTPEPLKKEVKPFTGNATTVASVATPDSALIADTDFKSIIWGKMVPDDSPLGKFLKVSKLLEASIAVEQLRLTTALTILETISGITKEQVLTNLSSAITDLTNARLLLLDKQVLY
jgi:hypothetical protein